MPTKFATGLQTISSPHDSFMPVEIIYLLQLKYNIIVSSQKCEAGTFIRHTRGCLSLKIYNRNKKGKTAQITLNLTDSILFSPFIYIYLASFIFYSSININIKTRGVLCPKSANPYALYFSN